MTDPRDSSGAAAPSSLSAPPPAAPHGESRTRGWPSRLIDRHYQLRFSLIMVLICVALMTGLGWMVLQKTRAATAVSLHAVWTHPEYFSDPDAETRRLVERERVVTRLLVDFGIVLTIALFFYGLRMTHKVANPLQRIGRHLERIRDGRFAAVEPPPGSDSLGDLYQRFRAAHAVLRSAEQDDVAGLREILAVLEKDPVLARSPEIARSLEDIKALLHHKEASLG